MTNSNVLQTDSEISFVPTSDPLPLISREFGLSDKCPHQYTLSQHLRGLTTGALADELDQHLETCAACLAAVSVQDSGDDFQQNLARCAAADNHTAVNANDLADRIATHIIDETSLVDRTLVDSETNHDMDVVLESLEPTNNPGHLGTLGRYSIVSLLGEGGMGIVVHAIDNELCRDVAIKILRPSLAHQVSLRKRFLREARAGAKLSHDHVAPVFDVSEHSGLYFFVMELLEGESLRDRLDKSRQLPVNEALRITREAAEALQAAHEIGLVHRDVKPENIWLDRGSDRVRLVDFGLAHSTTNDAGLTQSGLLMGTPRFMSPEQATCGDVDHRTDLFSLGSVLYRMLTGNYAVDGDSPAECFASLLNDSVPNTAHACPDVPEAVSQLVTDLLEKDPDQRLSSTAELLKRLGIAEDTSPDASPKAASEQGGGGSRFRNQKTGWFGFAGGLILLGIIVIIVKHKDGTATRIEIDDKNVEAIQLLKDDKIISETLVSPESLSRHELAQWVLNDGGTVQIEGETPGQRKPISSVPTEEFKILDIAFANPVSAADFRRLVAVPELLFLALTIEDTFPGDALQTLRHLKNLRYLNLKVPESASLVDDEDVEVVCQLPELNLLELTSPRLTGACLNQLARLKKFEHLFVNLPLISDDELRNICRSRSMYVLRIANATQLSDTCLQPISKTRVQQLDIQQSQITGSGFDALADLKTLVWLNLSDAPIENQYLARLLDCERLDHIGLCGTPIDDAGVKILTQSSTLARVALDDTQISDEACRHLAKLKTLIQAYLRTSGLTNKSLKYLASSPQLKLLYISGSDITDDGLPILDAAKSLEYAQLHTTSVSTTAVSDFNDSHTDCRVVLVP